MGGHHRIGRLLVDRIGERRHHAPFRCGWARLPDVGKAFLIAAKTKPPFSLETGGGGLRDPLDRAPALTLRDQPERILAPLAGARVVIPVERPLVAPAVGRVRPGFPAAPYPCRHIV